MLILAVGVLGIAALQFKGLQYSTDSYMRSQISALSSDMADRIRINRLNATAYVANYTVPAVKPTGCNEVTGANAVNDLVCWRMKVYDALPPNSTANITSAGDLYSITLGWTDRENTTRTIGYTFQP
jgi:type IV pilus assembly protein PilV